MGKSESIPLQQGEYARKKLLPELRKGYLIWVKYSQRRLAALRNSLSREDKKKMEGDVNLHRWQKIKWGDGRNSSEKK